MPNSTVRRRWQFTIRELLMLTVIVALLMNAWRMAHFGLQPSGFFQTFDLSAEMQDIAAKLGHPVRNGGGGGGGTHDDYRGSKKYRYEFQLAEDAPSKYDFIEALRDRIEERLADADCNIEGRGTSAVGGRLTGFGFQYTAGNAAGSVDVEGFIEEGRFKVILLMQEVERP